MDKDDRSDSVAGGLSVEALLRENEILAQQVKRLIKAESKLYQFQEELDAQLREYKNLHELSRKINATLDINKLYRYTVAYVVEHLEFERAIFLRCAEGVSCYSVVAMEGYYETEEKGTVAQLVLEKDDPLLSLFLMENEYLMCSAIARGQELCAWRDKLHLNEYFIYPLGGAFPSPALLVVGNTAEKAEFYRRVEADQRTVLSMGNLVGLISSSMENHIYHAKMTEALEQERRAEAKYRSIFENAVEGIFLRAACGRYREANPALARMLGYDSPQDLMEGVPDPRRLYVDAESQQEFVAQLSQHGLVESFETRMYRKDGSIIWVSASARVVHDEAGEELYEGTAEDITERKAAEVALRESERRYRELSEALEQRVQEAVSELRQRDKMLIIQSRQALMGEMIRNIAHQWRQPLNMLGLLAQDLQMTRQLGDFSKEYVETNVNKTMAIIQDMSRTIDDFRYFFRAEQITRHFRILESVEKTLGLLEGSLNARHITVEVENSGDPYVNGYPSEFSQVLINIIINARDALIERNQQDPIIRVKVFEQGGKAMVTVTDNAGGIPEDILFRVFEPYFTTKGPDQGTGIGLFMCKTIIEKNMGGSLTVRNVDCGAEFTVEVPKG